MNNKTKGIIGIGIAVVAVVVIALIVIFVGGSSSGASPIVGTWHTYVSNVIFVYEFDEDGTYVYTANRKNGSSSTKIEEEGNYTFDESKNKLTLKSETKVETKDVIVDGCMMMFGDLPFGKVYSGKVDCPALNDILGKWVDSTGSGSMTISKDGTAKMTIPTGSVTGIYVYNPTTKELVIPEAGFRWKLEDVNNCIQFTDIVYNGALSFVKK